ncbi:MAG: 30S ribosomal protein S6 [Desulfurivibrio sp.]
MRNYESVIIIRPGSADETELTAIIEKYSAVITGHEGEIAGIDRWGLKKLAYPIKKETQAVYILARFAATPEGVKEMERLMRIDDRVIKYLTVKLTGTGEPFPLVDEDGPTTDEKDDEDSDSNE